MAEHWHQLNMDEHKFLRDYLLPEEWSDIHLVDLAARCLIDARENAWAWFTFARHLQRERKTRVRRQVL